jgi:hypothetical protein
VGHLTGPAGAIFFFFFTLHASEEPDDQPRSAAFASTLDTSRKEKKYLFLFPFRLTIAEDGGERLVPQTAAIRKKRFDLTFSGSTVLSAWAREVYATQNHFGSPCFAESAPMR